MWFKHLGVVLLKESDQLAIFVAQIAKEKKIGFIDLRLSLLDPTDLRGIPFFDSKNDKAIWAPASFLPDGSEKEGILFLDELNTAAPMVQASAYQLILDRKIGEYTLPEGWSIIAAGNRESDRGVVFRMAAPLSNRFIHLEMESSVEDWKTWAIAKVIDISIIKFISYRPDALFSFDTQNDSRSFATPRTWEYVNEVIASEPENDLLMPLVSGAIALSLVETGEFADPYLIHTGPTAHLPPIPPWILSVASAVSFLS